MSSLFRRHTLAAAACTTLVLAPAAPAFAVETAEGTQTISILSFNDFHGALSADYSGTQFADTVEDYRTAFEAEHGADSTLLTSAGDLIGGSASVSNVQQDEPTIRIMNALGLETLAAGNHEFDRGLDDLRDRVLPLADFPVLSANFVDPQTREPVLAASEIVEVEGVRVAVIGASPNELYATTTGAGLEGNLVLDMVEAVNAEAEAIAAAGTADVIVASYHDGAAGSGALEDETAATALFDRMVNETSPLVDVIFNGHSHQLYQFETDNDGVARPVLQAGASGSHLAAVELTLDADGTVLATTSKLLERSTQDPAEAAAESAVTAEVYALEQEAVAVFEDMQSQVIADLDGSITTDYQKRLDAGGTWKAGGTRSAETTLGNWVANSIKHSVSAAQPEVDVAVVNPGGLRSELFVDRFNSNGVFTEKPEDLVGRLTMGEIMDVAPFGNTLTYFDIPGSSIKQALEQNWRDGERVFTLGWSEELTWTYDDSRPQGDKVTGVWLNGEPLEMDRMYTVAAQSFLADDTWVSLGDPTKAPDGYTAFAEGRENFVDLGVLDTTAVVSYARAQDAAEGAVSPDYAKKGVPVTGAPATVEAGQEIVLTLGDLVIDSDGAPAATSVAVSFVTADGETVELGTVEVPAGEESVTLSGITAPQDAGTGELVMTVSYEDGTTTVVRHALEVTAAAGEEPAEPTHPAQPTHPVHPTHPGQPADPADPAHPGQGHGPERGEDHPGQGHGPVKGDDHPGQGLGPVKGEENADEAHHTVPEKVQTGDDAAWPVAALAALGAGVLLTARRRLTTAR